MCRKAAVCYVGTKCNNNQQNIGRNDDEEKKIRAPLIENGK